MKVTLLPEALAGRPDVTAMLQAFYSRSRTPIEDRMLKYLTEASTDSIIEWDETKLEKVVQALKTYYVGYGHASIGDCGVITLFIEGVSILAAKAVQHFQLYNGQEVSTRYVDSSNETIILGEDCLAGRYKMKGIQKSWMDLYGMAKDYWYLAYTESLTTDEIKDPIMLKAAKAKALDKARGYLPCGLTTSLSWTGSFSAISNHINRMDFHPLMEVRELAYVIRQTVENRYPGLIPYRNYNGRELMYMARLSKYWFYADPGSLGTVNVDNPKIRIKSASGLNTSNLNFIANRSKGMELPTEVKDAATFQIDFLLDFGSARDLQRHRNNLYYVEPVAFIGDKDIRPAIHPWYLSGSALPVEFNTKLQNILEGMEKLKDDMKVEFRRIYDDASVGKEYYLLQYMHPLGTLVPVRITVDLAQLVYILELRTNKSVHPTLRNAMISVGKWLDENKKDITGLDVFPIYMDTDPNDDFTVLRKRGEQDIVKIRI